MQARQAEKAAEIPPLKYQNYPIDIHLRIYRDGAHYGADIFAVGRSLRVPIELTLYDLAALNGRLQETMRKTAQGFAKNTHPSDAETLLVGLAEAGNYAYKKVFSHPDARLAIEDLLGMGKPTTVQIATEDFFLPWEIFYPVNLDEPVSGEHFWGMNYVISRVIVQNARPGAFVSPEIKVEGCPTLGLCTYDKLTAVAEKEIPFFEHLQTEGKIRLSQLRSLDAGRKREGFREFITFWQQSFNLGHFACHADSDINNPENSHIRLSDEFVITLMDLTTYDFTLAGHPLIIMNACETGTTNPLYTSHFAAEFLKYGALGVVATECRVPDGFAANFAEQLYLHLLNGKHLGDSLLAVRRHFWELGCCNEHLEGFSEKLIVGNPSGLLYTIYAPPSIRISQIEKFIVGEK